MARIKIKDLKKEQKIDKAEMKAIRGGIIRRITDESRTFTLISNILKSYQDSEDSIIDNIK